MQVAAEVGEFELREQHLRDRLAEVAEYLAVAPHQLDLPHRGRRLPRRQVQAPVVDAQAVPAPRGWRRW